MKNKLIKIFYLTSIVILAVLCLIPTQYTFGQLRTFVSEQVGSSPANGDILRTDGSNSTWVSPTGILSGFLGSNLLVATDGSGNLVSTSTPTAAAYSATSTTATSTFSGGIAAQCITVFGGTNCIPANATSTGFWAANGTGIYNMNTGNVGIGTTDPKSKLHVNTTYAEPNGGVSSTTVAVFSNNNIANGTSTIAILSRSSAPSGIIFGSQLGALGNGGANAGYLYYDIQGTTDPGTGMKFGTNQNQRMIIDLNGNVGIGTTSPRATLHTFGATQNTAALTDAGARTGLIQADSSDEGSGDGGGVLFSATNHPFAAIKSLLQNGSGNYVGRLAFSTRVSTGDTALTEQMTLLSNGFLGIGTTTPVAKFTVTNTGTDPSFWVSDTTDPDTSPTVIDANGNSGLGTSTPASKLHVIGDIRATNGVFQAERYNTNTVGDTQNILQYNIGGSANIAPNNSPAFRIRAETIGVGSTLSNVNIHFQQNFTGTGVPATVMTFIGGSGNQVGIGVPSPSAKLDVASIPGGSVDLLKVSSVSAGYATTTQFVVTNAGNVGIASTTPTYPLSVDGSGIYVANIRNTSTGTNGGLLITDASGGTDSYALRILTQTSVDSFLVRNDGRVGISSSTPGARLSVKGAGGSTGKVFETTNSSDVAGITMTDGGNLGISSSSPSFNFSIGGIGSATSTSFKGSGTGKGHCEAWADSDGSGFTYVTANNGSLSASTIPCN